MTHTPRIPGLREAIDKEQYARLVSFLELDETVCGVDLRPFRLHDLCNLRAIKSPFIVGGPITQLAAVQFFVYQCTKRSRLRRWFMINRLGRIPLETLANAITTFLDEAFMDSPPIVKDLNSPQYYSDVAAIGDAFASAYGWSRLEIMKLPMAVLFQQLKCIQHHNDPNAIMFNPSDKVRGDWLRQQNEKRRNQ